MTQVTWLLSRDTTWRYWLITTLWHIKNLENLLNFISIFLSKYFTSVSSLLDSLWVSWYTQYSHAEGVIRGHMRSNHQIGSQVFRYNWPSRVEKFQKSNHFRFEKCQGYSYLVVRIFEFLSELRQDKIQVFGHHKVKSEVIDGLIRYDSSTRVWRELPAERKQTVQSPASSLCGRWWQNDW